MTSIKNVRANIDAHRSMKGLVEVYEEMAAHTMKEIREAILASRDYYRGLATLSSEVGADLSAVEPRLQKDALVLISSNEGMYGDIIDKVFGVFAKTMKEQSGADVYIAGTVGEELFKRFFPHVSYQTLSMSGLDMKGLLPYRKVEIFFGQFESIVRQEPVSRLLSAATIESTKEEWADATEKKLKYLYEPTVKKISIVFGEQIFNGILEQSIKEGELARNASRLMHLDEALTNIDKRLAADKRVFRRAHKRILGRKLQAQSINSKVRSKKHAL